MTPLRALYALYVCSTIVISASIAADDVSVGRFDWDLISLEQNNSRFNGSVLSGFHSVRSPGVTPTGAWKTGLGVLYSHEEQSASSGSTTRTLESDRFTLNPKINRGFLQRFEFGLGTELAFEDGSTVDESEGGKVVTDSNDNFNISAAVAGLKWNFFRGDHVRLATAFDTRIATRERQFGMLPGTIYNFEIDGDYAFTSKFSLISNLQFMTSDKSFINDQVIFDIGGNYSFSDQFRGMLFGTAQEDDEADTAVLFLGFAGQYVIQQHSFTLAFDFQLNDATREVRTESQIDLELSYTFTF